MQVDKKSMVALTMRGDAYYRMNEFELAQRHFREGLRLDPEHLGTYLHPNRTLFPKTRDQNPLVSHSYVFGLEEVSTYERPAVSPC